MEKHGNPEKQKEWWENRQKELREGIKETMETSGQKETLGYMLELLDKVKIKEAQKDYDGRIN